VWVKICGVRSVEMALHAQECGADAIGLNLHPPSPRYVSPEVAAEILDAVDIACLAVVVDRSEADLTELVQEIQPDGLQLHGNEPPGFGERLPIPLYKAFRARPGVLEEILAWGITPVTPFLLDAWVPGRDGGTGARVDGDLAREVSEVGPMILAGGLTPENVGEAVQAIQPFGVDVASGVESSPGVQDAARIAAFIRNAKAG
jgi:phosphoribosylanthranilate isomerase